MTVPADGKDRPNSIHWPPILYVIVLAAAWALDRLIPLPVVLAAPPSQMLGGPLFLLGLGIGASALVRFRIVGTTFDPTGSANALATGGIYRWTRNPMYLGAVIAFIGLGLAVHWTWLIVLTLPMAVALQKLAIEPEEAYLERRFGADYLDYKRAVRRWI